MADLDLSFAAEVARLLSGRNAEAAAAMLGGEVGGQWAAVMRDGRISISIDGSPAVRLDGDRATAQFSGSVNVRSPFGSNKRQSGRVTAQLQRNGDDWSVRSVRSVGSLSLS